MHKVTILDGGMGQELIARTKRTLSPMWSADIMLHEPELVEDLHLEFIKSGADVITLNNYTATPQRLKREGHYESLDDLHGNAMQAAISAKRQFEQTSPLNEKLGETQRRKIKIAGCLPPLVASYRSDACLPFEESLETYRHLVALQNDACDVFICETMSSIIEAKAACIAASESNKQVWLAFTVDDRRAQMLRSGELLSDALALVTDYLPDALLLNCSKPEAISASWPLLSDNELSSRYNKAVAARQLTKAPLQIGAYANGFTSVEALYPGATVEELESRTDLSPERYAQIALKWIEQGANIIGGCCEIGPKHIKALSAALA